MNELAARGDVLIVGRGGNRFQRERPMAFHARLLAEPPVRVRRVMEHRWVVESVARRMIAESDDARGCFHADYFGVDWSDPLEYCMAVNTCRLGTSAVDLLAQAAQLYWSGMRNCGGSLA